MCDWSVLVASKGNRKIFVCLFFWTWGSHDQENFVKNSTLWNQNRCLNTIRHCEGPDGGLWGMKDWPRKWAPSRVKDHYLQGSIDNTASRLLTWGYDLIYQALGRKFILPQDEVMWFPFSNQDVSWACFCLSHHHILQCADVTWTPRERRAGMRKKPASWVWQGSWGMSEHSQFPCMGLGPQVRAKLGGMCWGEPRDADVEWQASGGWSGCHSKSGRPSCDLSSFLLGYIFPWILGFYTNQAKMLIQDISWDLFHCLDLWAKVLLLGFWAFLVPSGTSLKGFLPRVFPGWKERGHYLLSSSYMPDIWPMYHCPADPGGPVGANLSSVSLKMKGHLENIKLGFDSALCPGRCSVLFLPLTWPFLSFCLPEQGHT